MTALTPGALYAVWDAENRIVGVYLGTNADTHLPEFRPLVWEGPDAEPLRHICAGPRAQVQPLKENPCPPDFAPCTPTPPAA